MGEAKKKKQNRKAAAKKAQRKRSVALILGLMAVLVAVSVCIWIVVYRISFTVKEHGNYSVGLNDDGTIIGFDASNIKMCDYSKINIPEEDIVPSEEDIDSAIASMMEAQGLKAEDLTDAFVQAYMPDMGSTVKEYRETYKERQKEVNLERYLLTYLNEHCEVKGYPEGYLEGLMGLIKKLEPNENFSGKEYYALLRVKAQRNANQASILQAVYEKEGLTISEANKDRVLNAYGVDKKYASTLEEKYGKGFLNQAAIEFAVLDYLKENAVNIEKEQEKEQ